METGRHQTENEKQKPRQFSLFHLPCAHCANGSLLIVRSLTKKQTEVTRSQTDISDYVLTDLLIYA
jgi:hypothetical protein